MGDGHVGLEVRVEHLELNLLQYVLSVVEVLECLGDVHKLFVVDNSLEESGRTACRLVLEYHHFVPGV